MARGNDGNLMQHAIEAKLIVELGADCGLHLITTHSMAPFEPLNPRAEENARQRARFDYWWALALDEQQVGEPCVLGAYRATRRWIPDMYPNTAEIAAELLGRDRLQGKLIEVLPEKCRQLTEAWAGTDVTTLEGSWRARIGDALPEDLDRPWVLSLDPMTYVAEHERDDNQFHPNDFAPLTRAMESLCATKQPGAMALFCYSMMPNVQNAFRDAAADALADLEDRELLHLRFADVAFGGMAHVAAIAATNENVTDQACGSWIALKERPLND